MQFNVPDILFAIFITIIVTYKLYHWGVLTMEMLYTIVQGNITVYTTLAILFIIIFIRKNASPAPVTQKLKQDILAFKTKLHKWKLKRNESLKPEVEVCEQLQI